MPVFCLIIHSTGHMNSMLTLIDTPTIQALLELIANVFVDLTVLQHPCHTNRFLLGLLVSNKR
jgi:hypothetical protein